MLVSRLSNNQPLRLDPSATLGKGGEATIYGVPGRKSLAAKIYHQPTEARAKKLVAMRDNPPDNPTRSLGHTSLSWPNDLLTDTNGQVVGYLMPRVEGMRPVFAYYNPLSRRQNSPLFDYRYLHVAAGNLTSAVGALHRGGYVIGDVNESNILMSDTALATLVDTDSFQVQDPVTGEIYRCTVGKPEFTPPELQGVHFSEVDRTVEHDRFGLACLLFRMLMEGTHPFDGVYKGDDEPPAQGARISAGHFPYGSSPGPYQPKPGAPPFTLLHPELQGLFRRAFEEGHHTPSRRPDAETWMNALHTAEKALLHCSANPRHVYGEHLTSCPWCERTQRFGGLDPFPSTETVRKGQHLRPLAPVRTPIKPSAPSPLGASLAAAATGATGASTGAAAQSKRRSRRGSASTNAIAAPVQQQLATERTLRRWLSLALALLVLAATIPLGRHFLENLNPDKLPSVALPALTPDTTAPPGTSPLSAPLAMLNLPFPSPPKPDALGQTCLNPKDGATMLWIPPGAFYMGSDASESERPRHRVVLPGYWIYKTPVTVAQYRKFCKELGRELPYAPDWGWHDTHPVVSVSWYDAKAYCDWAGVALPTEAQWEKAARGAEGKKYPWGDNWDSARCRNSVGKRNQGTVPVGSIPKGESPYGVQDMAGNVFQWCADWYDGNYYQIAPDTNPTGPPSGVGRVLRGGGWGNDDPMMFRTAYRYGYNPYATHDFIGFRGVAR